MGTASGVGKSRLVAGLCRVLARREVDVVPFKAQNMSLNSTVTASGHEIARSVAHQALAARTSPVVEMNPVLVKPDGPGTSQLVVLGRPVGRVGAGLPWPSWASLGETVDTALATLRHAHEVVLCEGAGGAAEINLLERDLANLPLAARAGLPAVLVGDIERGGVFAALHGTVDLLPAALRRPLRGFLINKLRGDPSLLASGIRELERRSGLACLGVLPHLEGAFLDEEDALPLDAPPGPPARASDPGRPGEHGEALLDVAIVALPHLANFTDADPLRLEPAVRVRYVAAAPELGVPDLVILPGSKATLADLAFLRERGLADALAHAHAGGAGLLGICAGYQMLGVEIDDVVESGAGRVPGLGMLESRTVFRWDKLTRRRVLRDDEGRTVEGYELHHGRVEPGGGEVAWFTPGEADGGGSPEGVADPERGIWGTSLHGLFEADAFRTGFLRAVAHRRGKDFLPSGRSFAAAREAQIDTFADLLESELDLDRLLALVSEAAADP